MSATVVEADNLSTTSTTIRNEMPGGITYLQAQRSKAIQFYETFLIFTENLSYKNNKRSFCGKQFLNLDWHPLYFLSLELIEKKACCCEMKVDVYLSVKFTQKQVRMLNLLSWYFKRVMKRLVPRTLSSYGSTRDLLRTLVKGERYSPTAYASLARLSCS